MEEADEEGNSNGIHHRSSREAGKARWVLNRRKQILVAAFLASSAPVVLPPLVVASVIGISVSMPYGLFLASHACTQKLMSKLLPMPTPMPTLTPQQKEDLDLINKQEATQEKLTTTQININMALGNENGEQVVKKDEPQLLQRSIIVGSVEHFIREEENASPEAEAVITIEGIEKIGNDIEEFHIRNTITLDEFEDEDTKLEKETKGLLEKIRDEGLSDTNDQVGVANASDQGIGQIGIRDERREDPEVNEHTQEVNDRNRVDSQKPIPSVENADETSNDPEDYTYTIELNEEESSITMVDEQTDPMQLGVSYVQNSTQCEDTSARDITSPSNEDMLSEKKLWKDINAIRLIVGYEGTPQASCIDELKNLYIVTGVEPPTLLNDSSDLLEVNDKIHFLMSILGVKSNVP